MNRLLDARLEQPFVANQATRRSAAGQSLPAACWSVYYRGLPWHRRSPLVIRGRRARATRISLRPRSTARLALLRATGVNVSHFTGKVRNQTFTASRFSSGGDGPIRAAITIITSATTIPRTDLPGDFVRFLRRPVRERPLRVHEEQLGIDADWRSHAATAWAWAGIRQDRTEPARLRQQHPGQQALRGVKNTALPNFSTRLKYTYLDAGRLPARHEARTPRSRVPRDDSPRGSIRGFRSQRVQDRRRLEPDAAARLLARTSWKDNKYKNTSWDARRMSGKRSI